MTPKELNEIMRVRRRDFSRSTDTGSYVYDRGLMCEVGTLEYDFSTGIGVLFLEPGSCTDMSGCIRRFEAIDPKVRAILTLKKGNRHLVRDTCYIRDGADWVAIAPEPYWIRVLDD